MQKEVFLIMEEQAIMEGETPMILGTHVHTAYNEIDAHLLLRAFRTSIPSRTYCIEPLYEHKG